MSGGIAVASGDGTLRVTLRGAVDLGVRQSAAPVWAALASGAGPVVVDCRDVTFLDSTGLTVLVRLVRDATEAGRSVRWDGASQAVTDLLEMTGVDTWMRVRGVQGI